MIEGGAHSGQFSIEEGGNRRRGGLHVGQFSIEGGC